MPMPWPTTDEDLLRVQEQLAREAATVRERAPWRPLAHSRLGGCFVAYARGEAGPGHPGDRAWAAAVVWRPRPDGEPRHGDGALRGMPMTDEPRMAADVEDQSVVHRPVPASYAPGLLALREGPVLAAALDGLGTRPDVVLVDATGLDHPRRAGLAVHLGAALDLPTIGVTHRGLTVRESPPTLEQRGRSAMTVDDRGTVVAAWVCTRDGTRPLLVHPGWRTDIDTAVEVTLTASTPGARTPVPLQEARRAAREARTIAGAG